MRPTQLLPFYHLSSWQQKTNGRPLLYLALAYAVAGQWQWGPMALNALAVCGVFMFASALDDYWDFRLKQERNFLSVQVDTGGLSPRRALWLACAPLFLVLPLFWAPPMAAPAGLLRGLLLVTLALILGYVLPPIRFKERPGWGFLAAPVIAQLLFLMSVVILRPVDAFAMTLLWLLLLFQGYAEAIHVADNASTGRVLRKLSVPAARRLMRWLPLASLVSALAFTRHQPVYLLGASAALIRWWTVRRLSPEQLSRHRRNLLSPLWSLYEFVGYAALGVWRAAR